MTMGLSWASIGAFVVIRRPENPIGRIMVVFGAAYALSMLSGALTLAFVAEGTADGRRLAGLAGWVTVLFTTTGALEFLIGLIFPTGRVQGPRWAWALRLYCLMMVVFAAVILFQPGPLHLFPSQQNPFGFGPDLRAGQPISPVFAVVGAILAPLFAFSLISRYRNACHTERQQLKWLFLALGASGLGLGLIWYGAVLVDRKPDGLGLTVYAFAAAGVPVAIAIAILRHNLYDIDRLISRSLGYALVTGMLAAVFAATAIGLSTVLGSLAQGESLAVAASTLVVLALFGPLRRRAQSAIDRRFDRASYDASRTVQALTARLRDDVDIDRVQADVLGVVEQTFHPAFAGLWLR
jgi:MFS family permease